MVVFGWFKIHLQKQKNKVSVKETYVQYQDIKGVGGCVCYGKYPQSRYDSGVSGTWTLGLSVFHRWEPSTIDYEVRQRSPTLFPEGTEPCVVVGKGKEGLTEGFYRGVESRRLLVPICESWNFFASCTGLGVTLSAQSAESSKGFTFFCSAILKNPRD